MIIAIPLLMKVKKKALESSGLMSGLINFLQNIIVVITTSLPLADILWYQYVLFHILYFSSIYVDCDISTDVNTPRIQRHL